MNSTKDGSESWQENSRAEQEAWKDEAQDGLLEIHATAAPLWSATGRIHTLQAPRPGHEDPEESELPGEWWCESQVASIDKHTCIDKSGS